MRRQQTCGLRVNQTTARFPALGLHCSTMLWRALIALQALARLCSNRLRKLFCVGAAWPALPLAISGWHVPG